MVPEIGNYNLYLVLSKEYAKEKDPIDIAKLAIKGGIDILQMREKEGSMEELEKLGGEFLKLCRQHKVIFIVNDDPHLARRIGADGVHLGQDDIEHFPIDAAREVVGTDGIIGLSTHSVEQFEKANSADVDYIAFGPIFQTLTKNYFLGTNDIRKVMDMARKPVVFIGGINMSNIDKVMDEGARNIAVIRDIVQAEDVTARTKALKEKIKEREKVAR